MAGDQKLFNNPEILNKKIGIGYLSKQKEKTHKKILKEELKLTPKKNKNNKDKDEIKKLNEEINKNKEYQNSFEIECYNLLQSCQKASKRKM